MSPVLSQTSDTKARTHDRVQRPMSSNPITKADDLDNGKHRFDFEAPRLDKYPGFGLQFRATVISASFC
jgi:hypothetical protein